MRVQYVSDLHLDILHRNPREANMKNKTIKPNNEDKISDISSDEGDVSPSDDEIIPNEKINYKNLVDPVGDLLILAGDICHSKSMHKFQDFFSYVSENFSYIIYVPGNHEYYNDENKTIRDIDEDMQNFFSSYANIIYLNNQSVIINNILFIGSCYWEQKKVLDPWFRINTTVDEINNLNLESQTYIKKILNNFQTEKPPITKHKTSYGVNFFSKNKTETNWRDFEPLSETSLTKPYKAVIITHYPPIPYKDGKSWSKNPLTSLNKFYDVWINGHTHRNHTHFEDGVLYLANQKRGDGYNNSICFRHS
jgi:predicted phosphohydrolase